MTSRHNSVRVEGDIWTMSPLIVIEGPLLANGFIGEGQDRHLVAGV